MAGETLMDADGFTIMETDGRTRMANADDGSDGCGCCVKLYAISSCCGTVAYVGADGRYAGVDPIASGMTTDKVYALGGHCLRLVEIPVGAEVEDQTLQWKRFYDDGDLTEYDNCLDCLEGEDATCDDIGCGPCPIYIVNEESIATKVGFICVGGGSSKPPFRWKLHVFEFSHGDPIYQSIFGGIEGLDVYYDAWVTPTRFPEGYIPGWPPQPPLFQDYNFGVPVPIREGDRIFWDLNGVCGLLITLHFNHSDAPAPLNYNPTGWDDTGKFFTFDITRTLAVDGVDERFLATLQASCIPCGTAGEEADPPCFETEPCDDPNCTCAEVP